MHWVWMLDFLPVWALLLIIVAVALHSWYIIRLIYTEHKEHSNARLDTTRYIH